MEAIIIISASSDIGFALGQRWLSQGVKVFGTYRTFSEKVGLLLESGAQLVRCDLTRRQSVLSACSTLRKLCVRWDVLILCPGVQAPIDPFVSTEFAKWEESVAVNFIGQLCIIRELLSTRHTSPAFEPTVLLFAGGGPNKATLNYSAYTVSKVALIKMCELLDAEIPDTRFVIINPGWVKTKAHETILKAGPRGGNDYWRTVEKFARNEWIPMERVIACCDWLIQAPRKLVGGRYFGVSFDEWGSEEFERKLAGNPNLCKLRRYE